MLKKFFLCILLIIPVCIFSQGGLEKYQRSNEEGKRHLDSLLTLYPDSTSFVERKKELASCLLKTMGINPSIKKNPLHPIIRSKRIMDGYSVESVAFESFPGFYVTGSLYRPLKPKGKLPAIVCPHGHFPGFMTTESMDIQGRYRPDMQIRCGALAKMGAVVFNYDMYGWGDSRLQTAKDTGDFTEHYTGFSLSIQTWNSIRVVDFLTSLPYVNTEKIGVTGASGGGTQTILLTALDSRIKASAPVVMVSSSFYGGCGCESGLPIHACGKYHTNNAEIAALAAPRPMLLVSDGTDWTWTTPGTDLPYLKKVYQLFNKESLVSNTHLPTDKHDYGYNKRVPVYSFFARQFNLNINAIRGKSGNIEEDFVKIEKASEQHVFSDKSQLPAGALFGHDNIVRAFNEFQNFGR